MRRWLGALFLHDWRPQSQNPAERRRQHARCFVESKRLRIVSGASRSARIVKTWPLRYGWRSSTDQKIARHSRLRGVVLFRGVSARTWPVSSGFCHVLWFLSEHGEVDFYNASVCTNSLLFHQNIEVSAQKAISGRFSVYEFLDDLFCKAENVFGLALFNRWFSGDAHFAELWTSCLIMLPKPMNDLSLLRLVMVLSPQIALVVCDASFERIRETTKPRISILLVKKQLFLS